MATSKNDAIEIDALLTPQLGDMTKVEKAMASALQGATKPLVDTLTNTKVGLDPKALRKAQAQLEKLGAEFGDAMDAGIKKVLSASNRDLRTAKGLRELAKGDAAVAKLVKTLGGYEQVSNILSRPDGARRLQAYSDSFKRLNDMAFQISRLPAVDGDVQKMLTKLYKGNSVKNFQKLNEAQQRQVRDAMAVIDLQDKTLANLSQALVRGGMGNTAVNLQKSMRQRRDNASRLNQVTSPQAIAQQERRDIAQAQRVERDRKRLIKQEANTRAVSDEKDRVLRRTGGIGGLNRQQDIAAVRAGLNRDYNLAQRQASIVRRTAAGGRNSADYKAATGEIDRIQKLRAELDGVVKGLQDTGRLTKKRRDLEEKADLEDYRDRGRSAKRRATLEQQADMAEYSQRGARARTSATYQEALRLIGDAGGIGRLSNQADIKTISSALNTRYLNAQKDVATVTASGQDASQQRAALLQVRQQREDLGRRIAQLKEEAAAMKMANAESGLRTQTARNQFQARQILRNTGGDASQMSRQDVAVVRPYLQDRLRSRNQYAEATAQRYGADSPEFARASGSARQFAQALDEVNTRGKELRPTISDLGQIVRSFFRYALGYGALYQVLGAVTALTKGLVDLDEQLYNIQAITLSTDTQMRTIEGAIKQVGLTSKFTLNEVAKGAQILAQAGTAPDRIPGQLRAVADFAASTNSTLEQSADLLTSFQNVYTDISDGKAADLLTKALNLSKLQGEDLRTIISYTAQTAEGYNISAEQLLGAAATLRNVGIKPSTIATGLRQAMLSVFNPDTKLIKALKTRYAQMGEEMSGETIKAMFNSFTFAENPLVAAVSELKRVGFGGEASNLFSRAFDVRAFNPLKALVNNFDQFNSLSGQVGVGQSATEGSRIQLESLRATLENLGASVIAFSDSVGGDMVRSLQAAAKEATDLVSRLTELDQTMKSETGKGLASTIGTGIAGGALGALLSGKGVINRTAGFAAGAYASGGISQAANTSNETSVSDYALPALAGLMVIAPPIIDFLGGLRGRRAEIADLAKKSKGIAGADISGTLGPALNMGAGLADLISTIGKAKMPKMAGIGAGSVLRLGAGLMARAIPVIGILWTAYELLSLFSDKGGNDLQAQIDQQRVKAVASGDRYRSIQAKYDADQANINEYRIDDNGQAMANTTAATAVGLSDRARNLQATLTRMFGGTSEGLEKATEMIREYARKDNDQRTVELAKINQLTGQSLSDRELYDLSSQMEELDKSVDGYRQSLLAMFNSTTDQMREAIARGDGKGIEKAGAMQRVLAEMPELQDYLYGRVEIDSSRVTQLYIEFNKRMALESEKGAVAAEEVLERKVSAAAEDIASAALALGDSPSVENAVQQIISNLLVTEKNTVGALDALAEKVRQKADEIGREASRLERESQDELAWADAQSAGYGMGFDGAYNYGLAESGKRKANEASQLRGAERAEREAEQLARAQREREQNTDDLARQTATAAAADVQGRITQAVNSKTFSDEFVKTLSSNQQALLGQLRDPAQLAKLDLTPNQVRTGQYRANPLQRDMENILQAEQQYRATQSQQSEAKKREAAKSSFASDPTAMVQIARLQNEQKAAERRNDLGGAQAAVKKIYDLQYAEQKKAVGRAKFDMEQAQGNDKKDATGAVEKYNNELAKLESMRGDMDDKIDQYQKKLADIDMKNRLKQAELDRDRVKGQFTEAVDRGDISGARKASEEFVGIQARLKALYEEELKNKGLNSEQIKREVEDRKDLTTTLIDQEGAQKRLTAAVLANVDFNLRQAGKGPTTGNRTADAYIRESGVGFTNRQNDDALVRDMNIYQQELARVQRSRAQQTAGLTGEEFRAADRAYIEKMEELQTKIGETQARLDNLRTSFDGQMYKAFNPTALLVQLEQSNSSLQNIGNTVQGHVVNAFDNLGKSIGRSIVQAEDLGDAVQQLLFQVSSDIFTDMFNTGFNYFGQQGLKMLMGGDETKGQGQGGLGSILGGLFGGGSDKAEGPAAGIAGALLGTDDASTGMMTVNAGTVMINGAVMGGAAGVPGALGQAMGATAPAEGEPGMFSKLGSMLGDTMGSLGDSLSNLFTGFTGTLGNLFSGLFGGGGGDIGKGMKGGDWAKLGVQLVGSYFGGMGGAAGAAGSTAAGAASSYKGAQGFASGGQPSRMIRGPKSAKRDNLSATAVVKGQTVPIRVEADEGILSRNAMAAIGGERGLAMLNSNRMPAFAAGGTPDSSTVPGMAVTTGGDRVTKAVESVSTAVAEKGDQEVNVANIYSEQGFADFVSSRPGRKVVINMLKKEGVI